MENKEDILSKITVNDSICNGKPSIRGKRIAVQTILEYLSAGDTPENIIKNYPQLERDDVFACIKFAASMMTHNYSIKHFE